MAKETAHQLGTPITSLQGWVELLKEQNGNEKISQEMMKDVDRLKLISDRFGKIGSRPQLEKTDLIVRIKEMVAYVKRRATEKVVFKLMPENSPAVFVNINPPLFDWVLENLFKNALDSMEGTGSISIQVTQSSRQIYIDVTDTGKGISSKHLKKIFKPGFTTKKRGWGLGLSLSKRIIEQYHEGALYVKNSEMNIGTTFRIVLKLD
jgi:signal transduction histidine kinase